MAVRPIDGNALLKELTCDFTGTPFHGNRKITIGEARRIIESMPTLTPPNEWVSVEERLPEEKQRVIVRCERVGTSVGWIVGWILWGNWMTDIGPGAGKVTHWMRLPEPPDRRPPEGEEETDGE